MKVPSEWVKVTTHSLFHPSFNMEIDHQEDTLTPMSSILSCATVEFAANNAYCSHTPFVLPLLYHNNLVLDTILYFCIFIMVPLPLLAHRGLQILLLRDSCFVALVKAILLSTNNLYVFLLTSFNSLSKSLSQRVVEGTLKVFQSSCFLPFTQQWKDGFIIWITTIC